MTQFLGTYFNKLDAKGRVSVPAQFRTLLRAGSSGAESSVGVPIILRQSHQYHCIEGWSQKGFESLAGSLSDYEQFSQEHDDFAMALYSDAFQMETDKEGRIVLPAELVAHAELTDTVAFLGLGRSFQIWEPAAAERRRAEARERARDNRMTLKARQDA
ncbi:MAG: division/cell wall cluster transcriptional repressor MraZ [Acetobacteraceae bacterium]